VVLSSATQVNRAPERRRAKEAILSVPDADSDDSRAAPAEGSASLPPPVDPSRKRGGWGPIGTYWRGEYSLGVSFWVFGLIIGLAMAALMFAATFGMSLVTSYNPYALFGISVLLWAVPLAIAPWETVGLWRSARRRARERHASGKRAFWAVVVQCTTVLSVLWTVVDFVRTGIPDLRENYALAFQGDPKLNDFHIRVMRGGTELEIAGGFKYGLDAALREALKASPGVKVVHLVSTGGRIGEAEKVYRTIKDHALSTYVADICYSACTLAFAAGRERWLGTNAQLGFHSASSPGFSLYNVAIANDYQLEMFTEQGMDAAFMRKALETPADTLLKPTPEELLAAHVITGIAPTDKFAASGLGIDLTQDNFAQWLRRASPALAAIEKGDPEVAGEMYRKYFASYVEGATLDEMLKAISADITKQIGKKKLLMDDETALAMGQLLIDQYRSLGLSDPQACYEYAKGIKGMVPKGELSDELVQRDRDVKIRILASTTPPQVMPKDELDQGWKAVTQELKAGPHGKNLDLFKRTATPDEYADYCAISIAYYEAILDQPAALAAALMRDTVTK